MDEFGHGFTKERYESHQRRYKMNHMILIFKITQKRWMMQKNK
jgi:hypothetical protein